MRKTILLLFLISPALLFGQETVKMGTFMLPPFMMEVGPEKTTGGVALDYWNTYIAPKMGVKTEAVGPFSAGRAVKMLEKGDVDVIPNMTKIPEREALFIFPSVPLAEITLCLVVLKEHPLQQVTKQSDLYHFRIGFLEGGYVPPLLKHEKISIELVSGADYFDRCLEKVEAGRNDAILYINRISLLYELKVRGKSDRFRIILLPVDKVKVYCIFRKTEKGVRLAAAFDKINAPLFRTGAYDKMAMEYLK